MTDARRRRSGFAPDVAPGVARLLGRLPQRLRDPISRGRRSLLSLLSLLPRAARLPAVGIERRGWVPCWAVRSLAVLLALGSAGLVVEGGLGWTLTSVLAVVILVRPGGPAAVILACMLGFATLQDQARLESAEAPLLLLGLHGCVALCLLIGTTAWTAKVQLSALIRPGLRFATIQLSAQLLGVLGALVAGRQLSWPWVPVVAALLIVVLLTLWLPMLGAAEE